MKSCVVHSKPSMDSTMHPKLQKVGNKHSKYYNLAQMFSLGQFEALI